MAKREIPVHEAHLGGLPAEVILGQGERIKDGEVTMFMDQLQFAPPKDHEVVIKGQNSMGKVLEAKKNEKGPGFFVKFKVNPIDSIKK